MTELYLTVIFFKKIVREIFQFIISFFSFSLFITVFLQSRGTNLAKELS